MNLENIRNNRPQLRHMVERRPISQLYAVNDDPIVCTANSIFFLLKTACHSIEESSMSTTLKINIAFIISEIKPLPLSCFYISNCYENKSAQEYVKLPLHNSEFKVSSTWLIYEEHLVIHLTFFAQDCQMCLPNCIIFMEYNVKMNKTVMTLAWPPCR